MKYRAILESLYSQPLAILPEKLAILRAFLHAKAAGQDIDPAEIAAITATRRADGVLMSGKVAILQVFGVITQRASMLDEASGGISTEGIAAALDRLVADKGVRAIVMAFDSPGGSVAGVPELAAKIRAARSEKRIVAMVDPVAASAAFWLAAQASEINIAPSGMIGSVGVITAHEDMSGLQEKLGVKTTIVSSSKYKAEGNPFEPLSEEAAANLQSMVGKYHDMFISGLAAGRGVSESVVEKSYGQGRMLLASDAVAAGMADKIATIDQVVKRLGGEASSGAISAATAAARVRALEVSER